jgi:hypothetical protein
MTSEGRLTKELNFEWSERTYVSFPAEIVDFLGVTQGAVGSSGSQNEPWLIEKGREFFNAGLLTSVASAPAQSINSRFVGKVKSRGIHRLRAIIRPKRKMILYDGTELDPQLIFEVPVAFYKFHKFMIRPPLAKGDIVLAVVSDLALDELIRDRKVHPPDRNRIHSIEDAVILGLPLRMDSDPYTPDESLDGLYFAALDDKNNPLAKWVMLPDGRLHIWSPEVIYHVPPGSPCGLQAHKNCVPQPPGAFYIHVDYKPGLTEPTFYEQEAGGSDALLDFFSEVMRLSPTWSFLSAIMGLDAVKRGFTALSQEAQKSVSKTLSALHNIAQKLGRGGP